MLQNTDDSAAMVDSATATVLLGVYLGYSAHDVPAEVVEKF